LKDANKILLRKCEGKTPFGQAKRKTGLKETWCDWIHLTEASYQRQAVVNMAVNFYVP
jgi:hypothetical protein